MKTLTVTLSDDLYGQLRQLDVEVRRGKFSPAWSKKFQDLETRALAALLVAVTEQAKAEEAPQ
jgi:hypothetical protein